MPGKTPETNGPRPDDAGIVMLSNDAVSRAGNAASSGMNMFRTLYRAFPDALVDDGTELLALGGKVRAGDVVPDTILLSYTGKPVKPAAIARKSVTKSYRVTLETGQSVVVAPSAPLFGFSGRSGTLTDAGTALYCRKHFIAARKKAVRKPDYYMRLPDAVPGLPDAGPASFAAFSAGYLAMLLPEIGPAGAMSLSDIMNNGGTAISLALHEIARETGAPMASVKKTKGRGPLHGRVTGVKLGRTDASCILSAVSPFLKIQEDGPVLSGRIVWTSEVTRLSVLRGASAACGRVMTNSCEIGPIREPVARVLVSMARSLGLKSDTVPANTETDAEQTARTDLRVVRVYARGRLDFCGTALKTAPKCLRTKVLSVEPAGPRNMTCIAPETGAYGLLTADYVALPVTLAVHEWDGGSPVYAPGIY